MSAASGIGVSKELSNTFAAAVEGGTVRFIKVAVENEKLVTKSTTELESATLEDDLEKLQSLLEDDVPAYVLARIGGSKDAGWLAITYVPDTASVRGKMLYASTRSALTKSLGSAHFPDSLFATSKADLTPKAYAAHKAHHAAPQPLSAREQEIADARAAERSSGAAYEGGNARRNHLGTVVGLEWSEEAARAVKDLKEGDGSALVLLSIDNTETVVVSSTSECKVEELAGRIPTSEPSYAFFAWSHRHGTSSPRRDVVFIYACPSSSPVKNRMVYSSGARALYHVAKSFLSLSSSSPSSSILVERKIETSDPSELTEAFLVSELGLSSSASAGTEKSTNKISGADRGFARPKGPGRKR